MSLITISRDSYSYGKEIAEKVARKLGYDCISRDILIEASREFNIPEMKLFRAVYDTSRLLSCVSDQKKYIDYIQATLLKRFKRDNVVYHGFAGHFFVKDIPHVLKIRIIAEMEERIRMMMERKGVARKDAARQIWKIDRQRRKWSRKIYGIDTSDLSLYDLVIHINTITVDATVDIICRRVGSRRFQTGAESLQRSESAATEEKAPKIKVKEQNDSVPAGSHHSAAHGPIVEEEVRRTARTFPATPSIEADLPAAAESDDYRRCEILIVDDEAIVCDRLKASLDEDGHRVETLVDPAEALRLLEKREFDIVISDIRMGEINGIQIMEKVFSKSWHPSTRFSRKTQRTKVIMITGYGTLDLARETLTKGAFDFIAKPFKAKEIRATIKRAAKSIEQNNPRMAER